MPSQKLSNRFCLEETSGGDLGGGGGGCSLILPIQECTIKQGMVFGLFVLKRVHNFLQVCPKQGIHRTQRTNQLS